MADGLIFQRVILLVQMHWLPRQEDTRPIFSPILSGVSTVAGAKNLDGGSDLEHQVCELMMRRCSALCVPFAASCCESMGFDFDLGFIFLNYVNMLVFQTCPA